MTANPFTFNGASWSARRKDSPTAAGAADVNAGQSNNTWLGAPSLERRPAYWLICSESLWFQEDCRPLVSLASDGLRP
jgi:hypothetical protein